MEEVVVEGKLWVTVHPRTKSNKDSVALVLPTSLGEPEDTFKDATAVSDPSSVMWVWKGAVGVQSRTVPGGFQSVILMDPDYERASVRDWDQFVGVPPITTLRRALTQQARALVKGDGAKRTLSSPVAISQEALYVIMTKIMVRCVDQETPPMFFASDRILSIV